MTSTNLQLEKEIVDKEHKKNETVNSKEKIKKKLTFEDFRYRVILSAK